MRHMDHELASPTPREEEIMLRHWRHYADEAEAALSCLKDALEEKEEELKDSESRVNGLERDLERLEGKVEELKEHLLEERQKQAVPLP